MSIRHRLALAIVTASTVVGGAACGLTLGAEDPLTFDAAKGDLAPGTDAATSLDDADAPTGAADAGVVCPPIAISPPDSGARSAVALKSTTPKVIDGVFTDWTGCPAIVLNRS